MLDEFSRGLSANLEASTERQISALRVEYKQATVECVTALVQRLEKQTNERLSAHDIQLAQLQQVAEEAERSRLEEEVAQWQGPVVRVEEASTQTTDLPELGPVWAAWDIAMGRPWSADLEQAHGRVFRGRRQAHC